MLLPSKGCRVALGWLVMASLLGGCFNYMAPFEMRRAQPGLQSSVNQELRKLPSPAEKVVVAVYRFRDQTGQYKQNENMASWSTAVTQGSTSILMRALEESGWFVPIEREGLSNLLNERQIISSIRAQHTGPDGKPLGPLPPLLYAGVLLEGGIIGYDSNVLTGGIGLRYFGAGGSGQFRQDQVTIYLRAVSTQSGQVLKTVHTTKTILSQKVDGGVFRYIELKRLLETEAGYSINEPPVIAITEAIEEAVKNLIVSGVRENLWSLANPRDTTSAAFLAYDQSVEESNDMNAFGLAQLPKDRRTVALGANLSAQRYEGDYVNPIARAGGELFVRMMMSPQWGLTANGSYGELEAEDAFLRKHIAGDLQLSYYVLPRSRLTPVISVGAGALYQQDDEMTLLNERDEVFPYITINLGLELMAARRFGLSLSLGNSYPLVEGLDGVKMGRINDNVWSLKTGLSYYLF